MNAGELDEAHDAFSLAIEGQNSRAPRRPKEWGMSCVVDGANVAHSAHHRERGKVRQLLRDFDGARQGRGTESLGRVDPSPVYPT